VLNLGMQNFSDLVAFKILGWIERVFYVPF